jgi:hypothetical protein
MNYKIYFSFLSIACLFSWMACNVGNKEQQTQKSGDGYMSEIADSVQDKEKPAFVLAHLAKVQAALSQSVPILSRTDSLDEKQKKAQSIAIQDKRFQQYLFEPNSQKATRNEIFGVYLARASDFTEKTKPLCADGNCYRVELYNYAINATSVALVNIARNQVVEVTTMPQTQPDIPGYLKEIAIKLALESPLVQNALGFKPEAKDALMSDTKTALNRSRCERSQHLCVAPTFVKGEKALWAIIDLTDMRLVGVRWTNVGNAGEFGRVTERTLQNEKLTDCYCKTEQKLEQGKWKLNYMLTSSDGMRISNVHYNNKLVVLNAKLVDWHVNYSNTDGFGYSDAVGCPYFSTAAVVAVEPPRILDLIENGKKMGFVLEQNYYSEGWPRPCNYNYQQRFEFYENGSFRLAVASLGRGCGNDGTYRPVTRIAFAGNDNTFAEWTGKDWKNWDKEQWKAPQPNPTYTPEGYDFKIQNAAGNGFFMSSGHGQFKDKGRGDNPFIYVTLSTPDKNEGESDLVTIGPCCNTDYHQGPEKFIEPTPENIAAKTLVVWYVAQMKNDDTKGNEYCWAESYLKNGVYSTRAYPCFSGPLFTVISKQ